VQPDQVAVPEVPRGPVSVSGDAIEPPAVTWQTAASEPAARSSAADTAASL
jgi:hypothetical protein